MADRVRWIDALRGFSMVAIVLGHAAAMGPLKIWLYSFHVPLFFFLSGLLFSDKRGFALMVRQKARQLLVPYYFFGVISMILYVAFGSMLIPIIGKTGADVSIIHNLFGLLYGNGKNNWMDFNLPLWFLPCIFSLYVLAYPLSMLRKKASPPIKRFYYFILSAFLACVGYFYTNLLGNWPLPFGFETAVNMSVFFFIGAGLAEQIKKKEGFNPSMKTGAIPSLLLFTIGVTAAFLNAQFGITDYVSDAYRSWLLFLVGAFGQGSAFVVLFATIRHCNVLEYIGKHTVAILVMHKFPLLACQAALLLLPGLPFWFGMGNPCVALFASCLAIGACLLIERFAIDRFIPWSLGVSKK